MSIRNVWIRMFNKSFANARGVAVVLGLLILCGGSSAQITFSTIRGTAVDPTGAVLVNAEVTLLHIETNAKRTTTTSQNGDFEIAGLQPGTYRLSVTNAGFKTFVADNVILQSGQTRRIDATMELGMVGTEVSVTAGAAVIVTETARVEGTVSGRTYPDAPWINVESTFLPQLMLTTLPLIQLTGAAWSAQWAGQSTGQVQQGQDGHTNDGFANQLNDIFDAEEIVVVLVNPTAEVARVGYFNQITKSGSNEFHGRLSYWHVNQLLRSREFFEKEKAKTLKHTISTGVSGPIIKNKTFFYVSANIGKIPSGQFYLRSVPTEKMRQGDFSQLFTLSRPITVKDPLTGNPFPKNVIPASRLNPLSLKVNQKYLPAPNRGMPDDQANNLAFTFPYPTDHYVREDFTQRIDHHFSASNRFMFRMITDQTLYVLPTNFPEFAWTRVRNNYHIVGEDTHIFSANLVNTARVGWYRERITDGGEVYGFVPFKGDQAVKELGLQGVNPQGLSAQGFPRMDIAGYPSLYTSIGGMRHLDKDWGFADSVMWSRGKHVMKFGGEYKPQSRRDQSVKEGTWGQFNFNGSLSGYGYGDFLLGLPYTSSRLNQLSDLTRLDSEFGVYITDDFKVTSRLTLNLGARWDRFGAASLKDDLMYRWDLASGSIVVPENMLKAVSPLYPKDINIVTGQVKTNPHRRNLVPRLGIAYRPTDRTVIRGGYGIYTETLGRYSRALGGGPFEITETYINRIESGQPLLSFPNPFPTSLAGATIPSQSFTGYPLDTQNGRIHQFNLTVERQIKDIGLRLTYVGSRNRGINYAIGTNKPEPGVVPFSQARRPWPRFIGGSYWRSDGKQNFNALTFATQRKMGQLTFDGHWTWASNYSNMQNLENPYSPLLWSRDSYPSRHRVVANAVWHIPVGRGRTYLSATSAAVNHVLSGWQLYWIAYFETGRFFTPSFSGADPSNTNSFGGLPDRVCNGNLPPEQRTITRWFDASCFVLPPAGRFGNSGVNVLEGPGNHMHHMSIAKTFDLTERWKFTFTAAASNVFNHPNFSIPSANISAPGTVVVISDLTRTGRGRMIELRGRIDF